MIYVGPRDDYGYNQAQAEAAAALKKMVGVKVVEEENVPETAAVQKTMTGMIAQDGASLVFPTSFGYFDPHMLAVAGKYPDARLAHCGGMWTDGKHPKNAASYFGYIDECQYLNGVIAGHSALGPGAGRVGLHRRGAVVALDALGLFGARGRRQSAGGLTGVDEGKALRPQPPLPGEVVIDKPGKGAHPDHPPVRPHAADAYRRHL